MHNHDDHTYHILSAIESGRARSQRALSRELGIALGLTNLLMRRLISRGFVQASAERPNRTVYCITPAGLAEKNRMNHAWLDTTLRFYTETRERIRGSLQALSEQLDHEADATTAGKDIVFYGAGEVAEIAYVGLQATDLTLLGVVDDVVRAPFFGTPVLGPEALDGHLYAGRTFRRIAIMSLRKTDQIAARIRARGVPSRLWFRL